MRSAWKSLAALLAAGWLVCAVDATRAAELIKLERGTGDRNTCTHLLSGSINDGDMSLFAGLAAAGEKTSFAFLCLNSVGGSIQEGIRIAQLVDDHNLPTYIRSGHACVGPCALVFMAGTNEVGDFEFRSRTLEPGGKLGFEAPVAAPDVALSREAAEAAAAAAAAQIAKLIELSGRYSHNPHASSLRAEHEYAALLPRPVLARLLALRRGDAYFIETLGDAILAGITIDYDDPSNTFTAEEAREVCGNAEFAATEGYTSWTKKIWQGAFVRDVRDRRVAALLGEVGLVLPFYDGIYPLGCAVTKGVENDQGRKTFGVLYFMTGVADQSDWLKPRTPAWYQEFGNSLLDDWVRTLNQPKPALGNEFSTQALGNWAPRWFKFPRSRLLASLKRVPNALPAPADDIRDIKINSTDARIEETLNSIAGTKAIFLAQRTYAIKGRPIRSTFFKEPLGCENFCASQGNCLGYSYDRLSEVCSVFSSIEGLRFDARFISGLRPVQRIRLSRANYAITFDFRGLSGGEMVPTDSELRYATRDECANHCLRTDACHVMAYEATTRLCTMYGADNELRSYPTGSVATGLKMQRD